MAKTYDFTVTYEIRSDYGMFRVDKGWLSPNFNRPKTPLAVCVWAMDEKLPRPTKVRWGRFEGFRGDGTQDWDGWECVVSGWITPERRTIAEVQLLGETKSRRVQVTFGWAFQNGMRKVNGGGWEMKEL